MLRHLDLFSGIGGFARAAQLAGGYQTVGFVELERKCHYVLRKHWPDVPIYTDIKRFEGAPGVDVITGGFPCQPHSSAARGRKRGVHDDRWLWPEMLRVIQECKPYAVIGENVTHLDGVALEQVVSDLETIGYETQTFEIPACAVGQDHWRPRLWVLGYSDSYSQSRRAVDAETSWMPRRGDVAGSVGAKDGIPTRMDRMRMIGNAIEPHIAAQFLEALK